MSLLLKHIYFSCIYTLSHLFWIINLITDDFYKIFRIYLKKYLPNEKFCDRIIFVSGDGGMADALDSGSSGSNPVRVQVPFSASEGAKLNTEFMFRAIFQILLCT